MGRWDDGTTGERDDGTTGRANMAATLYLAPSFPCSRWK